MKNIKKEVKIFTISVVLVIFALISLIIIWPFEYDEIAAEKHLSWNTVHILGTDYLGRDAFVRIIYAIITTLLISICSIFCSLIIGVLYGAYSGYKGGKVEHIMTSFLNILESIPDFLIAVILLVVFNAVFSNSNLLGIFVTLIIISWTSMARIITNETKKIMNNEFIQYAQIKNASFKHIFKFHLLPNLKNIITITTIQKIPSAIFLESFLSFVGIGIQPPYPSLGRMISEGIKYFRVYPMELFIPAVVLILIVMVFNLFGEKIIYENGVKE